MMRQEAHCTMAVQCLQNFWLLFQNSLGEKLVLALENIWTNLIFVWREKICTILYVPLVTKLMVTHAHSVEKCAPFPAYITNEGMNWIIESTVCTPEPNPFVRWQLSNIQSFLSSSAHKQMKCRHMISFLLIDIHYDIPPQATATTEIKIHVF